MAERGRFITFEGGEGVGKSTNLKFLENWLLDQGKRVVATREPGGTRSAEAIRAILLDVGEESLSDESELLLMFAARAEHIQKIIRPALDRGCWVLCDRFTDATYAYQGGGRGIEECRIAYLEEWIQCGLKPDLTLLFDAPVEIGMERAMKRGDPDRFESERLEFFERIRQAYLQRALRFEDRIRVIDASQPIQAVETRIRSEVAKWL